MLSFESTVQDIGIGVSSARAAEEANARKMQGTDIRIAIMDFFISPPLL